MKLPICTFDAKSGIQCPKCEAKLKSGEITQADVNISIKMMKITPQRSELDEVSIVRAFEVDGSIVLVLAAGDLAPFRSDYALFKKLEHALEQKPCLVQAAGSGRKVLEDAFFPVGIVSVNQVWSPDGSKMTRIVISGKKTERFPVDTEKAQKVLKAVKGIELLVGFERQWS